MEDEIKRRLKVLNKIKVPRISARGLRGGMQERLHRQERIRYGLDVESKKKKLNAKMSLIEQERKDFTKDGFGIQSLSSAEPLDDFDEPVFRRIRSRRGFF